MSASDRSRGFPLPSFGQLVLLAGLCAAGWWGRAEYLRREMRWRLSNPSATPIERMESIEMWAAGGADSVDELVELLASADLLTRRDAARALGRIGSEAQSAIPALTRALEDPNSQVRQAAIIAITRIDVDAPGLPERLMIVAMDEEIMVREVAHAAVEEIGIPAIPLLLPLVKHPKPFIRQETLRLAYKIAPDSAEVLRELRELAVDPDLSVRDDAIRLLIDGRLASLKEVVSWIHEKRGTTVARAIEALSQFDTDAATAVPDLIDCLQRNDWELENAPDPRLMAVERLRYLGMAARPAIPALLAYLESHAGDQQKYWILEILVDVGTDRETLVSVLVAALGDLSASETAGKLLTQVDGDEARRQVPKLVEQLRAGEENARYAAFMALSGMGTTAIVAVPDLALLLSTEPDHLAESAARILGALGPDAADAVPAIVAQLERERDSQRPPLHLIWLAGSIGPAAAPAAPALMKYVAGPMRLDAAIIAMARIGVRTPEFIAHLRSALHDQLAWIRTTALWALATLNVADAAFLPDVVNCLRNSDPNNRLMAAWTIGRIVGCRAEVVAELSRLLRDDAPNMRMVAATALGRLGPPAAAALPTLRSALVADENIDPNPRFIPLPFFNSREATPEFEIPVRTLAGAIAEAIRQIDPAAERSTEPL
jgi:HEAT repeat protein